MTSTASMAHNLAQARILIKKAANARARALFLPEAADYIGGSPEETHSLVRSVQDSEFVKGVQQGARESKIAINVGYAWSV
jgi:predicted amidohydrolase